MEEREAVFDRLRTTEWEIGQDDDAPKQLKESDAGAEEAASPPQSSSELAPFRNSAIYASRPPAMSIPLAWPFTLDGQRYRRIDIRPPARGDVEAVVSGALSELAMHSRMAGVSEAVMRALRWDDAEKVAVAARFLAPDLTDR